MIELKKILDAAKIAKAVTDSPKCTVNIKISSEDKRVDSDVEFHGNHAGELYAAYIMMRNASEETKTDFATLCAAMLVIHKSAVLESEHMRKDLSEKVDPDLVERIMKDLQDMGLTQEGLI